MFCYFKKDRCVTGEDHADVSADEKVEEGVYEHQPAQPTEGRRISVDGRRVRVAPLQACTGQDIEMVAHIWPKKQSHFLNVWK